MKYIKRLIVIMLLTIPVMAMSQQTISIITSSGPGSSSDTISRVIAPVLEEIVKRKVVVLNAPGANGVVAARQFLNADPALTMIVGASNFGYNAATMKSLEFDFLQDFEPIHGLVQTATFIYVGKDSPFTSFAELIEYYKKGRLLAGSTHATSSLFIEELTSKAGAKVEVINYRVQMDMMVDTSTGVIDFFTGVAGSQAANGLVDSGKLRMIAVIGKERHKLYPNIPSTVEQGYPNVETYNWSAIFVNKRMPEEIKKELAAGISIAMRSKQLREFANNLRGPDLFMVDGSGVRAAQMREKVIFSNLK